MTDRMTWVGILGYPIRHSLSPRMHNAAFEAMGLDYRYIPLEVQPRRVRSAVGALRRLGFRGFNVTIPHKRRILTFLDRVTPEARFIGAVNTVEIRGGRLIGHNTDGRGFLRALVEEAREPLRGKRVLILGAGGAARAVAFQSAMEGAASVAVINRSPARAAGLARDLRRRISRCAVSALPWTAASLRSAVGRADVVVNATSVGMKPTDPPILSAKMLRPNQIVCDLVYRPPITPLLREARRAGAAAVGGLGMLVYQGALAFEIWTGRRPPIEIMREALRRALLSESD